MESLLHSEKPFVLFLIGSPGSGKSHLIRYLVYELLTRKRFHYILSFCGGNLEDYDWMEKCFIHTDFDEGMIDSMIKTQKLYGNKTALFILDDVCGKVEFHSKLFKHLISTHRQINVSIICASQYLNTEIPPLVRNCTTHAVWFKQEQKRSLVALFESFGQRFENFDAFREFTLSFQRYEFILFDPSIAGMDAYKIYKAPSEIPAFNCRIICNSK